MAARMANPALSVPGAFDALQALATAAGQGGQPQTTAELVHLRASQIIGCSVCVHMHARDLEKAGESDEPPLPSPRPQPLRRARESTSGGPPVVQTPQHQTKEETDERPSGHR